MSLCATRRAGLLRGQLRPEAVERGMFVIAVNLLTRDYLLEGITLIRGEIILHAAAGLDGGNQLRT
jgi:hypothetical protein